jgi:hypothetical protein
MEGKSGNGASAGAELKGYLGYTSGPFIHVYVLVSSCMYMLAAGVLDILYAEYLRPPFYTCQRWKQNAMRP